MSRKLFLLFCLAIRLWIRLKFFFSSIKIRRLPSIVVTDNGPMFFNQIIFHLIVVLSQLKIFFLDGDDYNLLYITMCTFVCFGWLSPNSVLWVVICLFYFPSMFNCACRGSIARFITTIEHNPSRAQKQNRNKYNWYFVSLFFVYISFSLQFLVFDWNIDEQNRWMQKHDNEYNNINKIKFRYWCQTWARSKRNKNKNNYKSKKIKMDKVENTDRIFFHR